MRFATVSNKHVKRQWDWHRNLWHEIINGNWLILWTQLNDVVLFHYSLLGDMLKNWNIFSIMNCAECRIIHENSWIFRCPSQGSPDNRPKKCSICEITWYLTLVSLPKYSFTQRKMCSAGNHCVFTQSVCLCKCQMLLNSVNNFATTQ